MNLNESYITWTDSTNDFDNSAMPNNIVRKRFGKKIRKFRKEVSMSQEQLALAANIERSYLGAIERGQRSPTLDKIAAIAKALKRKSSELLD